MGDESHDLAWVLLCAALVALMQAGFCCLESGLVRTKNSINVAVKNLADFCVSGFLFFLFGYALMHGASFSGLFGTTLFFGGDTTPSNLTFFLFQLVFCGTATTIISGAVAERMRFGGYLLVAVITSAVLYPLFGHWVWGGSVNGSAEGWLARMGFIDFAGGTVVHSLGGWVALAAVIVIGPRIGRFGTDGAPIPGHNLPMAALGTLLLFFGWFGFNGGSTLGFTDLVPLILVNTVVSGLVGGVTAFALSYLRHGRVVVEDLINGILGGLVGVTACCHSIVPVDAVVIAIVAAVIVVLGTLLLEKLRIDDVIGAVPVHAFAGSWGTLAVAIFGDPAIWGGGSRWDQFGVQAAGVATCATWSFALTFVLLKAADRFFGLRVEAEAERVGLNVFEHEARAPSQQLLQEMELQRNTGDFSSQVTVESHTEVGAIAHQYNRVVDQMHRETVAQKNASEEKAQALKELTRAQGNLEEKISEMAKFNDLAVGRELRMIELKQEVNRLASESGLETPYEFDGDLPVSREG